VSEHGSRVVKFVFTDTDRQIFSWVRADSSGDPVGPHINYYGPCSIWVPAAIVVPEPG